jgi:hypothetical protein
LLRVAALHNPECCMAQAKRLSTFGKPRVVACAEKHPHRIGLPRGWLGDVRAALHNAGVQATLRDECLASARTERAATACAPPTLGCRNPPFRLPPVMAGHQTFDTAGV